jgi:hypothetical protein
MPGMGNSNNNRPAHFQSRGANFDNTTGAGNRDPWNNKIASQDGDGNQNTGNNDKNDKNDDSINDDVIDNIWEQVKKENGEKGKNSDSSDGNNGNGNSLQTIDPKKQMDDYLASVGLTPISFTEEEKEKIQNGDLTPMTDKMHQQIITAHTKALSGSKTMIDEAVRTAVAEATKNANATFSGQRNLEALHQALPFTKDKAIGPVAQTVMQRFLDRGMSTEDAIKGVDKFFKHTNARMNEGNINKNRGGNFSNPGNSGNQNDVPEGGWLNILSGNDR